ncbi:hypothetical protein C0J52_19454, partial [Blattella germanica]
LIIYYSSRTPVPLSWTLLQVGHIFIEPQVSKLEGFYCIYKFNIQYIVYCYYFFLISH